jgi:hypothetical protein
MGQLGTLSSLQSGMNPFQFWGLRIGVDGDDVSRTKTNEAIEN